MRARHTPISGALWCLIDHDYTIDYNLTLLQLALERQLYFCMGGIDVLVNIPFIALLSVYFLDRVSIDPNVNRMKSLFPKLLY